MIQFFFYGLLSISSLRPRLFHFVADLPSPPSIYHHSVRPTITTLHLPSQRSIYYNHSPFAIAVFDLLSPLPIYHHRVRSTITTLHLPSQCSVYYHHSLLPSQRSTYHHCSPFTITAPGLLSLRTNDSLYIKTGTHRLIYI